jgi:hypothetical protein
MEKSTAIQIIIEDLCFHFQMLRQLLRPSQEKHTKKSSRQARKRQKIIHQILTLQNRILQIRIFKMSGTILKYVFYRHIYLETKYIQKIWDTV